MSILIKDDGDTPAFRKGAGAAEMYLKAGAMVKGNYFGAEKPIAMPGTILVGTDFKVYMDLGSLDFAAISAQAAAPSGAVEVGGFHYAPGGNGSNASAGGDTVPQVNPFSIWDLNFRPRCRERGGMALIDDSFWMDIYLLGVNHQVNGTSRHGVQIANGKNRPIRPARYGGNGVATATLNWWTAAEIMRSHGKRLPSYDEAITALFGVKENASRGAVAGMTFPNDGPETTGLCTSNVGSQNRDEVFTSAWGIIQATGVHWFWLSNMDNGLDSGSYSTGTRTPTVTPDFYAVTEGRGALCQENLRATRGGLAGGKYNLTIESGSRALDWADALQDSSPTISARGVAAHHCVN